MAFVARIALALVLSALLLHACSDDTCTTVDTDVGQLCIPVAITAGAESVLEVREACGSDCALAPSCTASVVAGSVAITLSEDRCNSTTAACIATQCNHAVVPCALPALGIGDYPVEVQGGLGLVLHVRAQGVSACHLPQLPDAGTDAGTEAGDGG